MDDLFTYPADPGYKEPDTSLAAAVAMAKRAPILRERCLAALNGSPKTADEIAGFIGVSILAVRPRISELLRMGKVADTGQRRANDSGVRAKVWRVRGEV